MRTYTEKEKKQLRENPYTQKVTDHKLMFTDEFKAEYYRQLMEGGMPRETLRELGYDTDLFTQKQIDSLTHKIREQGAAGRFDEGRVPDTQRTCTSTDGEIAVTSENMTKLYNRVKYLEQQVEFMKRTRPGVRAGN